MSNPPHGARRGAGPLGHGAERETPNVEPDDALADRVAGGDTAAFTKLFLTYYAGLCAFTFEYVGTKESAEELVHDVFLRVWQQRRTWDPKAGVRAYLFAACRNRALNLLRDDATAGRLTGDVVVSDETPALGQRPASPVEEVEASELTEALRAAILALPERRRAVMTLRWQFQMRTAEIASVLGISAKAVEASFTRAAAELRACLARFR
jgi:RNA polymerase sigma-70 factor, ECF subfamily